MNPVLHGVVLIVVYVGGQSVLLWGWWRQRKLKAVQEVVYQLYAKSPLTFDEKGDIAFRWTRLWFTSTGKTIKLINAGVPVEEANSLNVRCMGSSDLKTFSSLINMGSGS